MSGSRLVVSCCAAFLILPMVSLGQSRMEKSGGAAAGSLAPTVSVHELKIPEKARDAYNKGMQKITQKDWAGSISEFQKAIAAYGDFYEAYYKIGIAELELKLAGDAEAAFRKSIELSEGKFAAPLFGLGLTLANGKQYNDAEAFIRAGLSVEPTSPAGHFTMAWVMYAGNRVAEAEANAKQAVLYDPNFAMAHLLLAQIHRRQNNPAALVEDLDAYLRLEPNGPRASGARAARAEAQRELVAQDGAAAVSASADR